MKMLLDPGHGGEQPGAVYGGVEEEDLNLNMAFAARDMLMTLTHDVLMTRDRDITLTQLDRVKMIDEYKAELFVSIHCNASANPQINGIETYYRDDMDYPLANCVHKCITTYSGRNVIGLFQDEARLKKRLAVLSDGKIPSVLIEVGYLSNPAEREYMMKNIRFIGELIAHGADWYAHLKAGKMKVLWPEGAYPN